MIAAGTAGAPFGTTGGSAGLARLLGDSADIRKRFDMLTAQASSGRIADTFAGLGSNASASLSLRPRLASMKTWQGNIDAMDGRAKVTQSAMTRVQSIAADMVAKLTAVSGLSPETIDNLAANAKSALAEVGNLLNSQYGDVYVFAGEDTANPPVPNADRLTSSGFFTQIAAAVGGLATAGPTAVAAATLALAQSNAPGTSPFSAFLSQPAAALTPPRVAVEEGQTDTVGLLASANAAVPSAGSSTTGSYMRDLMRVLATVGSLSSAQADTPGFQALIADTKTSMTSAVTAMAADIGVLGQKQSNLAARRTRLEDTATVLTGRVSASEDVDMAAVLSSLTQMQTQLQASYQLISAANALSLVKFLPPG